MKPFIVLLAYSVFLFQAANAKPGKKANRLIDEKSPYLQQHAYNPVDWYPWGEEAFAKAKKEDKMILLSVGYSTCHWCHVMERESFEDDEIAEFLNKNFVSVKLDREERPDVDSLYMTAYQAMTGEGGGWPLNMFLTPDLKPMMGGTYFPPRDAKGRPGFLTVVRQMQKVWTEQKEELSKEIASGFDEMKTYFEEQYKPGEGESLNQVLISSGLKKVIEQVDTQWGGFGTGQKFPQVTTLRFLLHSNDKKARELALMTCRKMLNGGIYDQVGGGIHRYAVDRQWLVPHFEKMLYDQAQVLEVFMDAYLITKDKDFAIAAKGIADYTLEQLKQKEGAFYSAQDAQSEGKEGKFFCWTLKELKSVLNEKELQLAKDVFAVTEKGNFLDHSDPEPLKNLNVLHFAKVRTKLAKEEKELAYAILKKLYELRKKRVHPATDRKVLASWNGLMIGALARASHVLGDERYLNASKQAHAFIKKNLWDSSQKKLFHSWTDGQLGKSIQTHSYLLMVRGSRQLYEATLQTEYLDFAIVLADLALKEFYDPANGGFYQGEKREDLVMRLKGNYDGAIATESSIAAFEYALLAEMTGRSDYKDVTQKTMKAYAGQMKDSPQAIAGMLYAVEYSLEKQSRLVIAGEEGRDAMLAELAKYWKPRLVVMQNTGPVDDFSKSLKAKDNKATAYLCEGQTCKLPVNTIDGFVQLLKQD